MKKKSLRNYICEIAFNTMQIIPVSNRVQRFSDLAISRHYAYIWLLFRSKNIWLRC